MGKDRVESAGAAPPQGVAGGSARDGSAAAAAQQQRTAVHTEGTLTATGNGYFACRRVAAVDGRPLQREGDFGKSRSCSISCTPRKLRRRVPGKRVFRVSHRDLRYPEFTPLTELDVTGVGGFASTNEGSKESSSVSLPMPYRRKAAEKMRLWTMGYNLARC